MLHATRRLLLVGVFVVSTTDLRADVATDSIGSTSVDASNLAYGREQVDHLLRDRPQLQSIISRGNEIDKWLVGAFAAPDLDFKLAWDSTTTDPKVADYGESASYPDANHSSYIRVDGVYKDGPQAGQPRTAEDILNVLAFEIGNARHGHEGGKLTAEARLGLVSRDDFILGFARKEYLAATSRKDFYTKIWLPFCQLHGISATPTLWQINVPDTFEEHVARYPRTFWYPWDYFGKRYDRYVAQGEAVIMEKAKAGDINAGKQVGTIFYGYRDYPDALNWYLYVAGQNDISAEIYLSWMYGHGEGVPEDQAQAFAWVLKAAEQGDVQAEKSAGYRYEHGLGATKDPVKAKFWYEKAAASHVDH